MNILTRLIFALVCAASVQVSAAPPSSHSVALSGHVASFLPQASRFQEIYGHSIPIYGAELDFQWHPSWELWTTFEGYSKSSHPCADDVYSSVTNFTFGIGPNFHLRPSSKFDVIVGLGPIFGAIHLDNKSWCEEEKTTAFVIGGVVRLNIRCWIHPRAFFKVFSDYSYQHSFLENNINVGGTKLGGGIGWKI